MISTRVQKPLSRLRTEPLLIWILALSLALRLSGIFWGLPAFDPHARYYHPDEPKVIYGAYTFPAHIWQNQDLRYPTAFSYSLGIAALPLRLLEPPYDYYAVYILGRLASVLAGLATILATYWLARQVYGRRHALLSAFLLAFSMLHVANSAWATNDVFSSLWLAVFLILLGLTLQTGSPRQAIFSGVALGLGIGTKYTAVIGVIPLVALFWLEARQQTPGANLPGSMRAMLGEGNLWRIGLVAAAVFILSTPGILLHPQALSASLTFENARLEQSSLPLYNPLVYFHQLERLASALGLPLALASVLGIVVVWLRRDVAPATWTLMLGFYCLYLGNALLARYFILVMPVLAILAARFLLALVDSRSPIVNKAGLALTIIVCGYSCLYSLGAAVSRYPDTRSQAAVFIQENLPAGASVGLGNISEDFVHLWRYPQVDFKVYKKKDMLKRPQYIILSSYEFDPIREILAQGVLAPDGSLPEPYRRIWYQSEPPTPEQFRMNEALWKGSDPEYCLLARFEPQRLYADIEFPPPVIEIYARQRLPGSQSVECQKP